MREYLPILIVGIILGLCTLLFIAAYLYAKRHEPASRDRNIADGELIRRLLRYAKPYWKQFVLVFVIKYFDVEQMFCRKMEHSPPHDFVARKN